MLLLCFQILLGIKIVAVVMSGSISLISSLVDSAVDLVSGIVIYVTTRAVKKTDRYVYPQGIQHLYLFTTYLLLKLNCLFVVAIVLFFFGFIIWGWGTKRHPRTVSGHDIYCIQYTCGVIVCDSCKCSFITLDVKRGNKQSRILLRISMG